MSPFAELIEKGVLCPRAARLRVLYVCTGNSCRSQMAEGWTRALLGRLIEPYSAGVDLHQLDPAAVAVMAEAGVDISQHRPVSLDDLRLDSFDCIVTLSERAWAGVALFGYSCRTIHQSFAASPKTGASEPLEYYRRVRDDIRKFVFDVYTRLINERR
ncbi:MAG: arsenate reductase ArsC [Kiritimatiellales bacterium]